MYPEIGYRMPERNMGWTPRSNISTSMESKSHKILCFIFISQIKALLICDNKLKLYVLFYIMVAKSWHSLALSYLEMSATLSEREIERK